jgi:hypothetical protein
LGNAFFGKYQNFKGGGALWRKVFMKRIAIGMEASEGEVSREKFYTEGIFSEFIYEICFISYLFVGDPFYSWFCSLRNIQQS